MGEHTRCGDVVGGGRGAQGGAGPSGARGDAELLDQYGRETVEGACEELMNYSERMLRREIEQLPDGSTVRRCLYTPHSLRATTATLLRDASVDLIKVKDLLGHRPVTTTQMSAKRRRSTADPDSHRLAI